MPIRSLLLVVALVWPGLVFADGDKTQPPLPTVESVWPTEVHMGQQIHVKLTRGGSSQLRGPEGKPLLLVLNGNVMPGLVGLEESAPDERDDHDCIKIALERTADNHDAWAPLLGRGKGDGVIVTVEGPGGRAIASKKKSGTIRFRWWQSNLNWLPAFGIMILAALLLVIPLFTTSMYRDAGTGLAIARCSVRQRGTFSLARCQIGFWFLNVVIAYTAIWAMTGATDAVTTSILAIIGIGSGTLLGAALIDQPKRDDLQKLRDEHQTLYDNRNRTPEEEKRKGELERSLCSGGFLRDILTDERSWSFHRVQLFVWTIVLVVVFWSSMLHHFAMPDFDATMLSLMGISSGTYLGLKMPENSQAPAK
jgi:hypothetical protein